MSMSGDVFFISQRLMECMVLIVLFMIYWRLTSIYDKMCEGGEE